MITPKALLLLPIAATTLLTAPVVSANSTVQFPSKHLGVTLNVLDKDNSWRAQDHFSDYTWYRLAHKSVKVHFKTGPHTLKPSDNLYFRLIQSTRYPDGYADYTVQFTNGELAHFTTEESNFTPAYITEKMVGDQAPIQLYTKRTIRTSNGRVIKANRRIDAKKLVVTKTGAKFELKSHATITANTRDVGLRDF